VIPHRTHVVNALYSVSKSDSPLSCAAQYVQAHFISDIVTHAEGVWFSLRFYVCMSVFPHDI